MRRYGEPRNQGVKYSKRPGVYVILPRNGRLLLTHQQEPYSEFQLPGGGIDAGESVICALHRECFEETGWRIANLRRLGVYKVFTYMPDYDRCAEKICHIYIADPVRKYGPPTEEGHTAVWMPPQQALGALGSVGDVAMVQHFLDLNPNRF